MSEDTDSSEETKVDSVTFQEKDIYYLTKKCTHFDCWSKKNCETFLKNNNLNKIVVKAVNAIICINVCYYFF